MNVEGIVTIDYTNYKGERKLRHVVPRYISWARGGYHPDQWVMEAWDIDKRAYRSFAMKDIHSWEPGFIVLTGEQK